MIAIVGLMLLLPILLAPLETAGWWSKRRERRAVLPKPTIEGPRPKIQLVYFTGVAGYSGDFLARREKALLDKIAVAVPGISIHHEIFPYSAANLALDGERVFRALWMWLHSWRLKVPNNVFDALIVIRNIGQLLVSADPRYGSVFNRGLAEQLNSRLDPEVPTVFLAYSGGAQMAVGAADELALRLQAPLHLIALGGVFTDDPGIRTFHSVTQLLGQRDRWVTRLGTLLFPGLWRWQFWSAWNRYKRSGKFQTVVPGAHCHVGKTDYFGFAKLPGQESTFADQTVAIVAERISSLS